jgi:hypothetical protein
VIPTINATHEPRVERDPIANVEVAGIGVGEGTKVGKGVGLGTSVGTGVGLGRTGVYVGVGTVGVGLGGAGVSVGSRTVGIGPDETGVSARGATTVVGVGLDGAGVSVGDGVAVGGTSVSVGVGTGVSSGSEVPPPPFVGTGVRVGTVCRWGFCHGAAHTWGPKDNSRTPIVPKVTKSAFLLNGISPSQVHNPFQR